MAIVKIDRNISYICLYVCYTDDCNRQIYTGRIGQVHGYRRNLANSPKLLIISSLIMLLSRSAILAITSFDGKCRSKFSSV